MLPHQLLGNECSRFMYVPNWIQMSTFMSEYMSHQYSVCGRTSVTRKYDGRLLYDDTLVKLRIKA